MSSCASFARPGPGLYVSLGVPRRGGIIAAADGYPRPPHDAAVQCRARLQDPDDGVRGARLVTDRLVSARVERSPLGRHLLQPACLERTVELPADELQSLDPGAVARALVEAVEQVPHL